MSPKWKYAIVGVVIIIVLLGIVAWQFITPSVPTPQVTQTTQASAVPNADTLIWDTTGEPRTLDPMDAYDGPSIREIASVYDRLVSEDFINGTLQIVPSLATSWEVDSSGRVWTFHLRQGVNFSNGDPFDANAVKYSFDRLLKMNSPSSGLVWMFSQDMNLNSTKVIDKYTVQITTTQPSGFFLSTIATWAASIVDPAVVEAHGGVVANQDNQWMYDHEVGTGPYMLVEWQHNQYIKLTANPNYWGGWDGKHVKNVVINLVNDQVTRELHLQKGDADVADVSPAHYSDLQNSTGVTISSGVAFRTQFVTINVRPTYHGQPNPLNSTLVRQAISYATDYDTIIQQVYRGYAIRLQGAIPKGMFGHDNDLFMYNFDVTKAKDLMKQAGYNVDSPNFKYIPLDLIYPIGMDDQRQISSIVQGNLASIGFEVTITPLTMPVLLGKMSAGDYQLLVLYWGADYNDPDDFAFAFLSSANVGAQFGQSAVTGDTWGTGWVNTQVDQLLWKAKLSTNMNDRFQLYKQAQEIAINDPNMVYVAQPGWTMPMRTWVHGFEYIPAGLFDYLYYKVYKEISTQPASLITPLSPFSTASYAAESILQMKENVPNSHELTTN